MTGLLYVHARDLPGVLPRTALGSGEYELPDAIDLLIGSERTIDAVRMDGWRVDVGYPEDREKAEEFVEEATASIVSTTDDRIMKIED
jgi:dTDP-glucose pyrophosphorylase